MKSGAGSAEHRNPDNRQVRPRISILNWYRMASGSMKYLEPNRTDLGERLALLDLDVLGQRALSSNYMQPYLSRKKEIQDPRANNRFSNAAFFFNWAAALSETKFDYFRYSIQSWFNMTCDFLPYAASASSLSVWEVERKRGQTGYKLGDNTLRLECLHRIM